jgi:hypothetical protein
MTDDIRQLLGFAIEISLKDDPDELDLDALVLALVTALALIRLTDRGAPALARSREAIVKNLVAGGGPPS